MKLGMLVVTSRRVEKDSCPRWESLLQLASYKVVLPADPNAHGGKLYIALFGYKVIENAYYSSNLVH
jgi:hypothetical protein